MTIVNHDAQGNQLSRFDTQGNALDAHDGTLVLFDGTYYLYGTSYACGYQYQVNSKFCGFKIYSSTDLVHFVDRGFAVPAADCQYCFRPHVIYNASTKKHVMWSDAGGVYHVRSSDSPLGPFEREKDPTLAVGGAVDESLFVDDDGTAYLIHNTTLVDAGLTADMVVEKLTPDYLSTTGESVRLGLGDVEAFAVFKRDGTYHALMSDPSCAYCSGGTGVMTAKSMLGPWSGSWYDPDGVHQSGRAEPRQRARLVNDTNCGGQPLTVLPVPSPGGTTSYLFVSDRWNNRAPNESLANFYIGPLAFDAGGEVLPFECVPSFQAQLAVGSAGAYEIPSDEASSSGFDGFRHYCDIQGSVQRQQSFTVDEPGTLTRATITTFRSQEPDAPLVVELLNDQEQVVSSTSLSPGDIPWAPRVIEVAPNLEVLAGDSFTLRLSSATTSGCYGFEYNDADPYLGGEESLSTNAGVSFEAEPVRDLKFTVDVLSESVAGGAGGESAAGEGNTVAGSSVDGGRGSVAGGSGGGGSASGSAGTSAAAGGKSTPAAAPSSGNCGCGTSGDGHGSVTIATLVLLLAIGRRRGLT